MTCISTLNSDVKLFNLVQNSGCKYQVFSCGLCECDVGTDIVLTIDDIHYKTHKRELLRSK